MDNIRFWLQDWNGPERVEGAGTYYYRSFDLNKFFEKIQGLGHKIIGIEFEGNNVGLIVEKKDDS